jgi:Domain of unknown function (DUF4411)
MIAPGGYVLDANVFIEANKRYYAFDICPGYWTALLNHHTNGRICSIDRVRAELVGLGDAVSQWAQQLPGSFFAASSHPSVASEFSSIMAWVQAQAQYFAAAKADFARGADGWLIAYAKVQELTIVTEEAANKARKNKVPIPNVCDAFGVKWINTFALLRTLGIAFN